MIFCINTNSRVRDPRKRALYGLRPTGLRSNVDLASDGKRIVALMPATESKGSQEAQNHVVCLESFFDELRRKVPAGK